MSKCPPARTSAAALDEKETFGLLMLSVRQSLIRKAERMLASRGCDINLTQYRVLHTLNQVDSMSASELARCLEHDGGALTRMVDGLQEKGYVERRPHATDRRAIELVLTAAGRALWAATHHFTQQFNEDVLGVLSPAEQEQLFALMRRIRESLDQQLEDQA